MMNLAARGGGFRMMDGWNGADGWGMMGYGGYAGTLSFVLSIMTWVLLIVVLIALARWLWKKGNGK